MLRRVKSDPEDAIKRPTYSIRLVGEHATLAGYLSFTQLEKLRKSLKAIVTHEILNYDKEDSNETR